MARTVIAVFDGEVLRPQQPLDLQKDRSYCVTIEDERTAEHVGQESGVLDDLLDLGVDTGITDLAEQHDHYLYGTPKR